MRNGVVLLPSYQPEQTLVALTNGLFSEGFSVLIVDDGSGEKYDSIFDACKEHATVIRYTPNKGKGEALKTGYRYILENFSNFSCVVTADGDGQHNIQDIIKTFERCEKLQISIIGERKFDVKVPIKSKLGNGLSKFTQGLSTNRYMKDNQCGLRAFPLSILPEMIKIKGSRYEYEMNVLTYLLTKEIDFQCIYVKTIYEEGNKTSHFRAVQDTLRIQLPLLLGNLIPLLCFVLQCFLTYIFRDYVFIKNAFDLEFATVASSIICLFLQFLIKLFVYKPKNKAKMFLRTALYSMFLTLSTIILNILFVRIARTSIASGYLRALIISVVPLYLLIKGFGIVSDSQINDEY